MDEQLFDLNAEMEERHWWFVGRRALVAELVESLDLADGPLLDVGCGTGATLAGLDPKRHRLGVDPSEAAIEHARCRFPKVSFRVGTAPEAVTDELSTAALVLLMDVLEHVEDDGDLLSSVVAGMSAGAYLLITVPAEMRLWSQHDDTHGHYRRYDVEGLRATWSSLPVSEVLVSPFNARLYPIVRFLRMISRRRGFASGEAGSDLRLPSGIVNRLLRAILAGEGARLTRCLQGTARPYRRGVSIAAVLRRDTP